MTSILDDALTGTPKPQSTASVNPMTGHGQDIFTRHMYRTLDGFVPPVFPANERETPTGHTMLGDKYNELYPLLLPPPMSHTRTRRSAKAMRSMVLALADLAG